MKLAAGQGFGRWNVANIHGRDVILTRLIPVEGRRAIGNKGDGHLRERQRWPKPVRIGNHHDILAGSKGLNHKRPRSRNRAGVLLASATSEGIAAAGGVLDGCDK